jgi:Fe-S-cluster containining protein
MIPDASTPGDPGPAAAAPLDCLTCGACCFQRPGTILVSENDLVRWKRTGHSDILARLEPGHFGQMAFVMGSNGACVHHGTETEPHACRIYDARSDTCRDFEAGSWQCLEFRRNRGIDPPLPGRKTRRG